MPQRSPFQLKLDRGPLPPPGGPVKTRLAVRAVIEREGLMLLVHSRVGGDWKFPGGGLEPRENPEEALAREVQEETGYLTLGRPLFLGRALERSEGRDVPGSLFEMESRYFRTQVAESPGALSLDAYEKELGFQPVWVNPQRALDENKALLSLAGPQLARWVARETAVLELLLAPPS